MRRGVGIARVQQTQEHQKALNAVGQRLETTSVAGAKEHLELLRSKLQSFATAHRDRINGDPTFRKEFFDMCLAAGVDPLASSRGLFDAFRGSGRFYDELAVQILTICMQTRDLNGGLLDLEECLKLLRKTRRAGDEIQLEDVSRAIDSITSLGRGVGVRSLGQNRRIVYSVPDELNADSELALSEASKRGGKITREDLINALRWSSERAEATIGHFIRSGLCWVDDQDESGLQVCWFPSIALSKMNATSEM
mmetsp:Transcript_48006/g.102827  ORF Transcript_48006/g.102827 Transcript_48006/m.102827 type:complete len:252 (-) Transcript_48006:284-1039(-)